MLDKQMEPITAPGSLESLSLFRHYVQNAAKAIELDQRKAYRLCLAVDEIVTNIIVHGYEEAGLEGDISLSVRVDNTALTVTIEDRAVPFDPRQHASPNNLNLPLEERERGGLGVYIALNSVDEFSYEYVDNKNRNTLRMFRSS